MFQMRDRNTDRDEDDEREHPGRDPHGEPPEDDDAQADEHDFWEEMERRHEAEDGGEA